VYIHTYIYIYGATIYCLPPLPTPPCALLPLVQHAGMDQHGPHLLHATHHVHHGHLIGRSGLYGAFDVTVATTVLSGVADALVQGGVIKFVLELPWYMQPVIAGTAASGELPSSAPIIVSPATQHHYHIAQL
jgi:hypothetical protein